MPDATLTKPTIGDTPAAFIAWLRSIPPSLHFLQMMGRGVGSSFQLE